MDTEHIPVRPKVNTSKIAANIFENSKDPDVQKVLSKKPDVLDMSSAPTKEEINSQKEDISGGKPWVVIALSVIIVILVAVIIYYALKYNSLLTKLEGQQPQPEVQMEHIPRQMVNEPPAQREPPQQNKNKPTPQELDSILLKINKTKLEPIEEETESKITEINSDEDPEGFDNPAEEELDDDIISNAEE